MVLVLVPSLPPAHACILVGSLCDGISGRVPDLCDDAGDFWGKVEGSDVPYEVFMLFAPLGGTSVYLPPGQLTSTPGVTGTLSFHWEIWKCQDYNAVNEVEYYYVQQGYHGSGGGLLGWSYDDGYDTGLVSCYYAPEVDAGEPGCRISATTPPDYIDNAASFTYAGLVDATGVGNWRGVGGPAALALHGWFDGTTWLGSVGRPALPVHADFIGT
jgi:hypothetical protein